MTPGRRFVHLVLSNMSSTGRVEYSLRHIDAARFFYPTPPPPPQPSALAHHPPSEPSRLPPPVMGFTPPHSSTGESGMEFMLLGTDKIVAADQTGRALLYDTARHTVRTMPSLTSPKYSPVALTVNDTDLYVMDAIPNLPSTMHFDGHDHDHGFDQLAFRSASSSPKDHKGDWACLEHPSIDCESEESSDPLFGIVRAAAAVERGDGSSNILVSKYGMGTYAFDTSSQYDTEWCKVGSWMLPFAGQGELVPKHGLWFGLTSRTSDVGDCDTDLLCAVDLGSTTMQQRQRPPTVRGVSGHAVVPPVEWGWIPETSRLVNMGNARFCVARFFISGAGEVSVHRYAVFTGVEVERCGGDGDAGGLRMVMHRSEVYVLPRETMYWVL
jgi:hypothetical protein